MNIIALIIFSMIAATMAKRLAGSRLPGLVASPALPGSAVVDR